MLCPSLQAFLLGMFAVLEDPDQQSSGAQFRSSPNTKQIFGITDGGSGISSLEYMKN